MRDDLADCGSIEEQALCRAIHRANREILATVAENPDCQGMGTTATLLHTEQGLAFWAHVGDSRLYLLRDGVLHQVTRDHSYVEELVNMGAITREEAANHRKKNIITRALGVDRSVECDYYECPLRVGEGILLCSDGLSNMVSDKEIHECFLTYSSPEEVCNKLMTFALERGARDNVTVVLVKI